MMRNILFVWRGNAVLVLAFAVLSSSLAAQSKSLPDAQIEANVLRALAGAPELATQAIKTTTVYGTVTLSGSVSDEAARSLAETLASKAQGVQKVVDELTLASEPSGAADLPQDSIQNQDAAPQLLSDGTTASPESVRPAYPEQGAVDPRYGPAGPPPDVQGAQDEAAQGQGAPHGDPSSQGGPGAPPVYREPYRATPSPRQGQQAPTPQYGAQEGGQAVTIPSGALLRVRLVEGLTAKRIQAGTVFDATVLNDVIADGEVAIPRGASVQGTIVQANASGAVHGKGQLALQLNSVSLSGRNYPILSDTWTHYGRDKTGQTVGSAVGLGAFGALIGAVAGGGAGAAIGAVAGGAAGIGASAATGRNDVVIPAEAIISFHLIQPAGVTTVSQQEMDRLGYGVQQANLQRRQPPPPRYYGRPAYYPY